jgi:hypothetical protein
MARSTPCPASIEGPTALELWSLLMYVIEYLEALEEFTAAE